MSRTPAGEALVFLLVEDNAEHTDLVMRCFRQQRISNRIVHIEDGQKALDYLFREAEFSDSEEFPTPHCILLELHLPRVEGLEVLRRIKADPKLARIPVVILTTSSSEKERHKAEEFQADCYLEKPLDSDMLSTLMDKLGYYWLLWDKNPQH